MSNNNIYPIQLLNDLHNWYPDVLYNPARFHTVQDLLDYIRSGADVNPYTRGLSLYNSWRHAGTTRAPTAVSASASPSPVSSGSAVVNPYTVPSIPTVTIPTRVAPTQTIPNATTITSTPVPVVATVATAAGGAGARYTPPSQTSVVSIFEYLMDDGNELTPTTNIRASIPLTFSDTASNRIGTSILSALLGLPTGAGGLESFLNQTVTVRPTQEQIAENTTLSTSERVQEDNCAICQDSVDAGQEMRRINHCGHFFHKDCIDTWLSTNVHCPTCRHDIRETSSTSGDSVTGVNEYETDSDTKTDI
jgi:hypothetical protein